MGWTGSHIHFAYSTFTQGQNDLCCPEPITPPFAAAAAGHNHLVWGACKAPMLLPSCLLQILYSYDSYLGTLKYISMTFHWIEPMTMRLYQLRNRNMYEMSKICLRSKKWRKKISYLKQIKSILGPLTFSTLWHYFQDN